MSRQSEILTPTAATKSFCSFLSTLQPTLRKGLARCGGLWHDFRATGLDCRWSMIAGHWMLSESAEDLQMSSLWVIAPDGVLVCGHHSMVHPIFCPKSSAGVTHVTAVDDD